MISLHFGAMSPSIKKQLPRGTLIQPSAQANADAITRLHVHGLLTEREAHAARMRLVRRIERYARGVES